MKLLLMTGAGLWFAVPTAYAQADNGDLAQFKACAQIEDNKERLACFDAAAATFDFAKAKQNLKEAATLKAEAAKLKEENRQRRLAEEQRDADLAALALEEFGQRGATDGGFREIKSTIVATKKPGIGGLYIKLENGHIWQNVDKRSAGSFSPGTAVTIKETSLGGLFMSMEGSSRSIRVKRVN